MNHIYRVVFNRSLGIYQCVSELAKSGGKSSGRSATRNNRAAVLLTVCSAVTLGMTAMSAQATTYSSGTTTIPNYTIDNSTDIIENSGTVVTSTNVIVGDTNAGAGNLTIQNAGALNATNDTTIGLQVGSVGNLTVTGATSTFINGNILFIGNAGKGSVTVADGGSISADTVAVGFQASGEGGLTVTGTGSNFIATNLVIGFDGKGSATVADGGSINSAATVAVGLQASGEGALTVTGTGSTFTTTNDLIIGEFGKGTLTIENLGKVTATNVSRETTSTLSTLNFDNGSLTLSAAQPALFNNFTSADTINLKGGGGTIDTNGFAVGIASSAVINGVGRFTKQGAGTLTMNTASKAWTGGTKIDQGTLAINGNFTLNEALTIGVTSATDYGKLDVTGIADISAGTLVVDASAAVTALTGSTPLSNIVTATTLTGEFASISSNSPLITLQADYSSPNAVHLNLVKTVAPPVVVPPAPPSPVVVPPTPTPPVINSSFVRSVSQFNPNNLGIAYALDAAIDDRVNNGNNALADALISSTINFNESQLAIAANDLQPLLTGATNRIITDANYMASNAITDHSSIGDRGLWAQIIGNQSNQDSENGISGYDTDSYGAISGLDFPINSDLNLGVSVSYIDSATDNRRDEMSAKSIQVLSYGNHALTDATRLSFHAGVGRSDVEGDRQLSVLSKAIANSDYKVDTLQAGLGISHRIGSLQRNVSPFAQVNYAQAKSDSYRESGAGVYNLDVNDNTYESMRWTAGLKMAQALTPQITLTGQVAAVIENGDRYSDTSASFANNPDTFTTIGQEVGREMGIAGIGIRYMPTPFTALSAGYNGKWGDNYADQGASVALKMMF